MSITSPDAISVRHHHQKKDPIMKNTKAAAFAAILTCTTLLLAGCSSSTSGASGSSGTSGAVVVGSDLSFPPYDSMNSSTNKATGFDPAIVKAIAAQSGLNVTFKDTRFEQLIPSLKSGNIDLIASALYITKDRATQVDFIPYITTGSSIVIRTGSAALTSISDLCGKSVAAIKGGNQSADLRGAASTQCTAAGKKAIDVHEFPTDPEGTQALISGQVDAQISDAAVAAQLNSSTKNKVKVSSTSLLYPIPVGFAVKKGNTALKNKITQGLEKIKKNGQYKTLLKKYNLGAVDQAQVDKVLK